MSTKTVIVSLASIVFLGSCAPSPRAVVVPPVNQTPAAVATSPMPVLEEARRSHQAADAEGARAIEKVSNAGRAAQDANTAMQSLVAEAKRLREQKSATEEQLLDFYNQLVAQEKRSRVLVAELASASQSLDSERALRAAVSSRLSETEILVAAKDSEARELRDQLVHQNQVTSAYGKAASDNANLAAKYQNDVVAEKERFKIAAIVAASEFALLLLIGFLCYARKSLFPL